MCLSGPSPGNSTQTYVGLVTGALAMTVLLVAGVAVGLALKRGRQKVALLQFKQATLGAPKQQSINMKHLNKTAAAAMGSSSLYGRSGLIGGVDGCDVGLVGGGGGGNGGVGGGCHIGHESEDSDNSSVYHEPYKRLPSIKTHDYAPTTFLFKKDVSTALTTSKSSDYTGKYRGPRYQGSEGGGMSDFADKNEAIDMGIPGSFILRESLNSRYL